MYRRADSMVKGIMKGAIGLALLASLCASASGSGKRKSRKLVPKEERYVVVLSLDGFRDDYQTKAHTPNLDQMDKDGLSGSFRPCYPSLTFPNHYSMATGLHPDHHGIVANEFWDERGKHYRLSDRSAVEDPVFYYGEPLWNTAKRQGLRTASFYWVGSETAINGSQPDRWKKFDSKVPYVDRADTVLSWLSLPKAERPHLIMWYLEEPDHTGHTYSPDAPETAKMIEEVDSVVGYFRKGLAKLPHSSKVDFILVSDHGMARFDKSRIINFSDYLPLDSFEHVSTGPLTHLYPKPGYTDKAIEILKTIEGIKVYRKGELPKRFYYGTSPRIGEIVVVPEVGITTFFRPNGVDKTKVLAAGHGFDNQYPEMLALFKAVGPHFSAGNIAVDPVPNITLYPLVCRLLGIKPAKHDANEALAKSLMRE